MMRVLVLAEGATEQAFVKRVLAPHFLALGCDIRATQVSTQWVAGRREHRGGHGNKYSNICKDVRRLLGDTDAAIVTTLLDYYRLPHNFPGFNSRPSGSCYDRVAHVEQCFGAEFNDRRFLPFLVLHEFEALLFSSPRHLAGAFSNPGALAAVEAVRGAVVSPEEIDDNPQTSPSHRIAEILPYYDKVANGPTIAEAIGLPTIRQHCPHFRTWLDEIERRCQD